MKISYNWLKQYADFVLTPEDLAEVLTGTGLEVEDIVPYETITGGLEGVVIGEVLECSKHPDADKLSVTKVNVGHQEPVQIVCGAPNVAAGQKVLVATVGSTLYPTGGEKLSIKKAKIRGVESYGMICAEDELGLGQNHDGIMVLPAAATVGTRAADYFKIEKDYVFEIGLTPNRGDANSHIGVARDVVAALNVAYRAKVNLLKPQISLPEVTTPCPVQVIVEDKQACSRYSAILVDNITVGESPEWLKNRLKSIGVKCINNVVDITNFVLHEYGQPLHAFDADKITGGKVVVKKLAEGTTFLTLDGNTVKLSSDDLMICNAEEPMCIAGVFGGLHSGVTAETKAVFIESAYFDATGIRKTSTRLGLRTDAATHFEKGTDPNGTVTALMRAAQLMQEICGGKVASSITDVYPSPVAGWTVEVNTERMLHLAGFTIEEDTIRQILSYLEIEVVKQDGNNWQLLVPPFKTDVKREADIVEEILRIYGYNSFTLPKAIKSALTFSPTVNFQKIENHVAEMLSGFGLNEIWTNSVSQSKFETDEALQGETVKLLNSQTAELDAMRTSMLYNGLEVIAYNQNRKQADLRLFEFGKTYHKNALGYQEKRHLAIYLTGKTTEENWLTKAERYNFYHLKNLVSNVLLKTGHHITERVVEERAPFVFSVSLLAEDSDKNKVTVARFGEVSNTILKKFDIRNPVFYADINWDFILEKSPYIKTSFRELPKFPSVKRDLAMVVDDALAFSEIEKIAVAESKKFLQEVTLFDVFKGDKIGAGKKSYAVSFIFQHPEKTLTDEEVEKVMNKLMNRYEKELGAIIRKN